MMKEFKNEILYHYTEPNFSTRVTVSLENGKLYFSGTEYDENAEAIFGKGEYDYCIKLSESGTLRFLELIGGLEAPLDAMRRQFSDKYCGPLIKSFCEKNDIKHEYSSYF